MATVNLKIEGMSCGHCVMHVSKALKSVAGVTDAQVQVGAARVTFEAPANVDLLKAAVAEEGYEVVGAQA